MAQNFDRRRINGPEDSILPVFDPEQEDASPYASWKTGDSRRGRAPGDIRPIFLKPGLITQANGSAYVETERTKLVCAVYGPRQSKSSAFNEIGKLNVEVKFAPFSCRRRRAPIRDAEDRSVAGQVHQALVPSVRLELLPKSTVDVFISVLENDGVESCVAVASIAASTALADAGVEMVGLVAACAASTVDQDIWLDPSDDEVKLAKGTFLLACMPALGSVTSVWQTGTMPPQKVIKCMELCQERSVDVHGVMAQALLDHAKT